MSVIKAIYNVDIWKVVWNIMNEGSITHDLKIDSPNENEVFGVWKGWIYQFRGDSKFTYPFLATYILSIAFVKLNLQKEKKERMEKRSPKFKFFEMAIGKEEAGNNTFTT